MSLPKHEPDPGTALYYGDTTITSCIFPLFGLPFHHCTAKYASSVHYAPCECVCVWSFSNCWNGVVVLLSRGQRTIQATITFATATTTTLDLNELMYMFYNFPQNVTVDKKDRGLDNVIENPRQNVPK